MPSTSRWFGLDAKTRLGVKSLIGVAEPKVVTGAYTLEAQDAGRVVEVNAGSGVTVTVPKGVFEAGQTVVILQVGPGQITLAAGAGLTLTSPSTLKVGAQWGTVVVRFRAPVAAVLSGNIAAA